MHLDQRPCAFFGRCALLEVEAVRTWACLSATQRRLARLQHQSGDAELSYLLVLIVLTVSTWWGTTETGGIVSLHGRRISGYL